MKNKIIKSILAPTFGILSIGAVTPIVMSSCGEQAQIHVKNVTLDKSILTLGFDGIGELKATVEPENATNKNITWKSSNDKVAYTIRTSDSNTIKVFAGSEPGAATITATTVDGGHIAKCEVNVVKPVLVESVTLNTKELNIETGSTMQLTATVLPAEATNKNLMWTSSNERVAWVDQNGLVYAAGDGKATITVTTTDGSNKEDTCEVTTSMAYATKIELDKDKLELFTSSSDEGKTYQLKATVTPAEAVNKKVNWSSSDNNIATVDENGLVTAVAEGKATITAILDNGMAEDQCVVEVINFSIAQEGVVEVGLNATSKLTIKSAHNFGSELSWMTGDKRIATVEHRTGEVKGVSEGTCKITAIFDHRTESGDVIHIEDTCEVKVVFIHAKGITLQPDPLILWAIGSTAQLTPIFNPSDASNKNVTWSSSDEKVATVDENGKVTAVALGNAVITVTTEDGGFKDTSNVAVKSLTVDNNEENPTNKN